MIEIRGLGKSFGDLQVLKSIDLSIEKNHIYGLVGSSGAGKSTLLRCINGLTTYDSGSLKVDGSEVSSLKKAELREFRRGIGMIFQQFSLLERLDVYENIALPMRAWKYDKNHIDKRVKQLLEVVGLRDKIHSRPAQLSGGQKQRVAIARALTMEPKLLLCDEATSALDPNTSKSVLDLIWQINRDMGITVVIVAHQMNVIKQICNRMALLNEGVIVENNSVDKVFFNNSIYLQDLLGEYTYEALPEKGINLRILIRDSEDMSKLLSRLAIETGVEFGFVTGVCSTFRNNRIGTITINIDDMTNLSSVKKFLEEKGVEWKEVVRDELRPYSING